MSLPCFCPQRPGGFAAWAALCGSPSSLWKLLLLVRLRAYKIKPPRARTAYYFQAALSTQQGSGACIPFCWTPAQGPHGYLPHAGCLDRAKWQQFLNGHIHLYVSMASIWGQANTPQDAATHSGDHSSITDGHCLTTCKKFAGLALLMLGGSQKEQYNFIVHWQRSVPDKLCSSCLGWCHPESFSFVMVQVNYLILLMLLVTLLIQACATALSFNQLGLVLLVQTVELLKLSSSDNKEKS